MVKVLVVDDAPEVIGLVRPVLERDGHEVLSCEDGESALELIRRTGPDLVVLDVGLPGDLDGLEVCRQLRTFSDAYVIMLTARDDEVDKIIGLSVGADDYLTKPFSPRELAARVTVMMRRPRSASAEATAEESGEWTHGPLRVDPLGREAWLDGVELELTRIEFDLLALLVSNPRMVFTRRVIRDEVWGANWFGSDHVIDVHVANLRKKLDANGGRHIRTVRGVGYRLADLADS